MGIVPAFARELSATLRFAVPMATVAAVAAVGVFQIEARLIGVATTTVAHVAVAGFMPAFFGAWLFFLVRRFAWTSPLSAFSVATAIAAVAFHAHGIVMGAHFHGPRATWTLPNDWCRDLLVGALIVHTRAPAWDATAAWTLIALGVGVGAASLQRRVVRPRSAP